MGVSCKLSFELNILGLTYVVQSNLLTFRWGQAGQDPAPATSSRRRAGWWGAVHVTSALTRGLAFTESWDSTGIKQVQMLPWIRPSPIHVFMNKHSLYLVCIP